MDCPDCVSGKMEWRGREYIDQTDENDDPITEVYMCYECSFCGSLDHSLAAILRPSPEIEVPIC